MNKQTSKKILAFAVLGALLLMILPLGVACDEKTSPASASIQDQSASTANETFLPGEVLVKIPVYPGAVGTTLINPEFGPSSFLAESPGVGPRRFGYQSASAQYSVQATMIDIDEWYSGQLAAMGYRVWIYGNDGPQDGTFRSRHISCFLPSQPLVSVQVNIYTPESDTTSPVFELMVVYKVPLPKPSEEILPTDIDSVRIDYSPGTADEQTKTISDRQAVQSLVKMINDLPVRPDYVYFGGMITGENSGPKTLFSLSFHSTSAGNITVAGILGENNTGIGIHIGDYPILEDVHSLLKEAVENMLGISNA